MDVVDSSNISPFTPRLFIDLPWSGYDILQLAV